MMTTRARDGSADPGPRDLEDFWSLGRPSSSRSLTFGSVIAGGLVQQPAEPGIGEALRRAVEPLHRPGPEVEIQRADRRLDGTPQRPAVLPGQPEQPGARDLGPQRPAVV